MILANHERGAGESPYLTRTRFGPCARRAKPYLVLAVAKGDGAILEELDAVRLARVRGCLFGDREAEATSPSPVLSGEISDRFANGNRLLR